MFGDYNNFYTNYNTILNLFKIKQSFLWLSAWQPQSGIECIPVTIEMQRRKNPVHFRIGFFCLRLKKRATSSQKQRGCPFLKELQQLVRLTSYILKRRLAKIYLPPVPNCIDLHAHKNLPLSVLWARALSG